MRERGREGESDAFFFPVLLQPPRAKKKKKKKKGSSPIFISPCELPRVHVPRRGLLAVAGVDAGVLWDFVVREKREGGRRKVDERRKKRERRRDGDDDNGDDAPPRSLAPSRSLFQN